MSAGWDDVRLFLAVAEAGSLSAAAATLGCSQPTIGRRLKALERDLGLTLHERHANRIVLTAAGRAIAAEAARMADAAAGLDQAARALAQAEPGPLRISATGSLAYFLTLHQAELAAGTGGIAVTILASRERANLARREADVALRMRRLPEDGDLTARRLARLAHAVYGASREVAAVIGLPDPERRPGAGYRASEIPGALLHGGRTRSRRRSREPPTGCFPAAHAGRSPPPPPTSSPARWPVTARSSAAAIRISAIWPCKRICFAMV